MRTVENESYAEHYQTWLYLPWIIITDATGEGEKRRMETGQTMDNTNRGIAETLNHDARRFLIPHDIEVPPRTYFSNEHQTNYVSSAMIYFEPLIVCVVISAPYPTVKHNMTGCCFARMRSKRLSCQSLFRPLTPYNRLYYYECSQ